jgi:hypothetical protein
MDFAIHEGTKCLLFAYSIDVPGAVERLRLKAGTDAVSLTRSPQ